MGYCATMIELDKSFESIIKAINECYEAFFSELSPYPKFTFSRAMILIWRNKVYAKIKNNLLEAFAYILKNQRNKEINEGKSRMKYKLKCYSKSCPINSSFQSELNPPPEGICLEENFDTELLFRFVQSIADISINELTIHYLGSTKMILEEPYNELSRIILKSTK